MRVVLMTVALFAGLGPVLADETIIHREGPGPVEAAPAARDTTIVKDRDCASKTVHHEDGAGDSKTVTKTNCD